MEHQQISHNDAKLENDGQKDDDDVRNDRKEEICIEEKIHQIKI